MPGLGKGRTDRAQRVGSSSVSAHRSNRLRASLIAVLAIVLALTAAGCGPTEAALQAVGVSETAEGQPKLLYVLCPGEYVKEVALNAGTTATPYVPPRIYNSPLIWEVELSGKPTPATSVSVASFVPGRTPPGFKEREALTRSLVPGRWYYSNFNSNLGGGRGMAFRLQDLRRGEVFSDGDYLTLEQFRERGGQSCNRPTSTSGA